LADLCLLGYYLKNVHESYKNESEAEKQRFYKFWGALYSGAFMVLPFATFLATVIDPWVREEVIFLLTNLVHAALLTSLVVGLWPERHQAFFCLQVDEMELARTIGLSAVGLKPFFDTEVDDKYQDLIAAQKTPAPPSMNFNFNLTVAANVNHIHNEPDSEPRNRTPYSSERDDMI